MFRRLCIANRGEIAVRIARTCRRLGIESHALYSDVDACAMHVRVADSASRIGAAPVAESYLRIDAVIDAALAAGCDALHPGYGLRSESAEFARACRERGLTFVGPAPEHIELMGDKQRAREEMARLGFPVVPGSVGLVDDGESQAVAAAVGYPLMIKASHGGGGIGMAAVGEPSQLGRALARARSAAQRSFGSPQVYLERQIQHARHVELQILGDGNGDIVVVGDRECSVQRRHQKVIEEAPSPALDDGTRATMVRLATRALSAIRYANAGTIECLLDDENHFYFLEMNTRLQVEHPVTEMVAGLDLVEWQLRIAAGESLDRLGGGVLQRGHALEARLYAEDPETMLPAPGVLETLCFPSGAGIRIDSGVEAGDTVSPYYDPLMAKLIVHAPDRGAAIERLVETLAGTSIAGLKHNIPLLQRILAAPAFTSGSYSTALVPELLAAARQPAAG